MDTIISDGIPYLQFLNDKNQSFLLQTTQDTLEVQNSNPLGVEPVFAEYVNDGTAWTVPVYLNSTEETNEAQIASVESAEPTDDKTDSTTATSDYPIEIPGKGFLTSSGIFFSNEVLLHFNLQEGGLLQKDKDDQSIELQVTPNAVEQEASELITEVTAHKCKECNLLFESYEKALAHVQEGCLDLHRNNKLQPRIQKMSSILKTDDSKKPKVKDIFLCGMCDNVGYEKLDHLKRHMLNKHNLTYKENAEGVNTVKDNSNKAYFQMMINKQQAECKRVKCILKGCDARFSRVELMMRHHVCHVNDDKKKFKCPECGKIFFLWRLCSAHLWKCHKIDIGLFTCSICNVFKSLTPHRLTVHMARHDDVKPFLCSICGKGFKQGLQLRNHQVAVHRESVDLASANWINKANCQICNKAFSTSKHLKKHVQAVHNKFKPFICNICGHQCARKAMLELHLRQHTGEKPYKCEMCDYKTGDHNSLRRHMSRHYGDTKYSCSHCDYQCVQSVAFKSHMKKKHPGKSGIFSCLLCSFDTVNELRFHDHLRGHNTTSNAIQTSSEHSSTTTFENNGGTLPQKLVPNVEDEETQPGLFSDHLEDIAVDTGGITIPAGSEIS